MDTAHKHNTHPSASAASHHTHPETSKPEAPKPVRHRKRKTTILLIVERLAGVLVIVALLLGTYAFVSTPSAIRQPAFEHYHFRMQLVTGKQTVNFSNLAFQEGYSKDNCNVALTKSPMHFHDSRDQMVHIHWKHMTGGLVLKYYGWNYIGGMDTLLGYRFDRLPSVTKVPIHGKVLPELAKDTNFYVYTGDEKGYQTRAWEDFLKQDLETFFDKQSNAGQEQASLLDKLFPKASAHAGHSLDEAASGTSNPAAPDQDTLKRINNLLGNVVIFAQKDAPADADIKAKFNNLVPLEASTCGG